MNKKAWIATLIFTIPITIYCLFFGTLVWLLDKISDYSDSLSEIIEDTTVKIPKVFFAWRKKLNNNITPFIKE
jgi:hypothetical protein